MPASRITNPRQRIEETPTHTGGLTESGLNRLKEYRRNRDRQRGSFPLCPEIYGSNTVRPTEGITASQQPRNDGPRGLGEFQRRLNRDHARGWNGNYDRGNNKGQGWDVTPQRERGGPASSVRVPNIGWESTPRNNRGDDSTGWGGPRGQLEVQMIGMEHWE
jgi:pre-mRNA-splicing factor ATP-dependent RNA helicase DHX38/PRP16